MSFESKTTVGERFFEPLKNLLQDNIKQRSCPRLDDWQWVQCGLSRVIGVYRSGRDFLQSFTAISLENPVISRSNFFACLRSSRRLRLLKNLSEKFRLHVDRSLPDNLSCYNELKDFEVFAGDGHYLEHATHDQLPGNTSKRAIAHFFCLNMRSGGLGYLSLHNIEDKKKEHDMSMLKRIEIECLRQNTPKARKVIWVWDKAGIDFTAWHKWKENHGIYFISREKENMNLTCCGHTAFNLQDPINLGVLSDQYVGTSKGTMIRRITFTDYSDETTYTYITSEMTLPPGLIALLYKMRWNIEKVFDQTKTKLAEKKAWATRDAAKESQAHFICLAYHAMLLYEHDLKRLYQIDYVAENKRREKRYQEKLKIFKNKGFTHTGIYSLATTASQRSLKFIRWLRYALNSRASESQALPRLTLLYQSL